MVTARIEEKADCRDPLDLTFVNCLSALENEPQQQQHGAPSLEVAAASTPANIAGTKRKVKKTSPDAVTPSDEETGVNKSGSPMIPRASLRRLRTKERRPQAVIDGLDNVIDEASSVRMSADTDHSEEPGNKDVGEEHIRKQALLRYGDYGHATSGFGCC
ncbi:unnamed protein product [Lasius platythorax]|uniref:Sporulation protein n=2 Tax=Lasius TaxID=488720 RepID=A0A0J7KR64_LASNI|nr:sporulation protein [Lasius niger]